MDTLAQTILPYILLYKYWALFALTFVTSLAVPMPSATLLMASAAFASQGYLNFFVVLIVVIAANIIGDNVSYWIFRLYGHRALDRFRITRKILHSKNFMLIEASVKRRSGFVIFISRFESVASLTVNAVSGLSGLSYKRFMLFEALGAIAEVVLFGSIGFVFGDSWEAINSLIGNFSIIVFIILFGALLLFWKKIMSKVTDEQLLEQDRR